jgi:hypothetical protein
MRCSAINQKGEQCPWEAVGRHGWCRRHSSMRRVSVKAVLQRWCGIGGISLVVLGLIDWFVVPMHRPFLAGAFVLVTSLLIASWQEWVLALRDR